VERQTLSERRIIGLLGTHTNVPVPSIIAHSGDRVDVGTPYILLTRMPGVNLDCALPTLTEDEQRQIGRQIGAYMGELHSIRFASFGELAFPALSASHSEKDYTFSRVEQLLQQCEAHDLLSLKEICWIGEQFVNNADCFERHLPVLVHGI